MISGLKCDFVYENKKWFGKNAKVLFFCCFWFNIRFLNLKWYPNECAFLFNFFDQMRINLRKIPEIRINRPSHRLQLKQDREAKPNVTFFFLLF